MEHISQNQLILLSFLTLSHDTRNLASTEYVSSSVNELKSSHNMSECSVIALLLA